MAGKLAKLLLSCAPVGVQESAEFRLRSNMTHEEMAQRIGSSRETVTRLLSDLKKKRLIRLEGATLVIRDRPALEALAVCPSPKGLGGRQLLQPPSDSFSSR
jgi:CRP/FNR family transcriptional regulator, cyclic AMP receptor protein